jgi:hypothetical protein
VATDIKPQKTTRSLRYDFSDDEIRGLGGNLVRAIDEQRQIENEKKTVVSQFKSRLDGKHADIEILTRNIQNGFEYRSTNCEIRFNDPAIGKKTTYRLDTNKAVDTQNMSEAELQLKIDLDHENSAELAEENVL